MVREEQVRTASVNINAVLIRSLKMLLNHGGALDVPSRPSFGESGIETDIFLAFAGFPEGKISGVAFFTAVFDTAQVLVVIMDLV